MKGIRTLSRFGISLLVVPAVVLFLLGVVQAQPMLVCIGPTQTGCTSKDCFAATGQCNSQNWDGQETETFDYRKCNGAAGPCAGGQAQYKSCENRFYTKDMTGLCGQKECSLITEVRGACAP